MSGLVLQQPQFTGMNGLTIPTTDNAGIIANYDNMKAQQAAANGGIFGSLLGGLGGCLPCRTNARTDRKRSADRGWHGNLVVPMGGRRHAATGLMAQQERRKSRKRSLFGPMA